MAARIAIAPDGVHVQYRVYGTGEPALVFIHGWSCDSNYWREQVAPFSRKYTLVMVDLAGHGGTDGNRSDWTIARFGGDVAAALSTVSVTLLGLRMIRRGEERSVEQGLIPPVEPDTSTLAATGSIR